MSGTKTSERALPGNFSTGWIMARLFFRLTLGRRRTLWLGLALLVPVALSLWWRIFEGGAGTEFFLEMTVNVILQFFTLGLTLYLGVAAVRDEIEDRTIVYLFARPVPRSVILAGKIVSVMLAVALALGLVTFLVYLVTVSADGAAALGLGLPRLLIVLAAIGLACLSYTALFSLLGTVFGRPMIPAVVLAFGWEGVAANLPGGFPRASLMFYIKSLLGLGPETTSLLSMLIPSVEPAPVPLSLAVLLGAAAVFLSAALIVGSSKEYRV